MYYRYEIKCKGYYDDWTGVFQFFDPSQRRKWYCLHVPKYYEDNPDTENTRSWFTQHGYDKYHEKMDAMLSIYEDDPDVQIRILTAETLDNIVMQGKTQCIQLI